VVIYIPKASQNRTVNKVNAQERHILPPPFEKKSKPLERIKPPSKIFTNFIAK